MARPYKIDSTNTVAEENLELFAQPIIDYCVKNNVRPIIVATQVLDFLKKPGVIEKLASFSKEKTE